MNMTRIAGLLVMVASLVLSACGGGGAATTATPATAPTSAANSYTGPAAKTTDITAFQVNFWNNVRVQNRCGQCHNATTPAQMPNFARNDDVNLAYAQANTVVNLTDPALSRIVVKVGGGHNCWLADPSACATILTQWITNWAGASAGGGTQIQLTAPVIKEVGGSKNFPADPTAYLSEPGDWFINDHEAQVFRQYLQKGGFFIVDDFRYRDWPNFEEQMHRVLPQGRLVRLDASHQIFTAFFPIEDIDAIVHPMSHIRPSYYGIFENNDPSRRLMVVANFDNDVPEYWEWSGQGMFPFDSSNEAYKLGVNYFIYGLTH